MANPRINSAAMFCEIQTLANWFVLFLDRKFVKFVEQLETKPTPEITASKLRRSRKTGNYFLNFFFVTILPTVTQWERIFLPFGHLHHSPSTKFDRSVSKTCSIKILFYCVPFQINTFQRSWYTFDAISLAQRKAAKWSASTSLSVKQLEI